MRKIDELLQLFNGIEKRIQTSWDWMESECFDNIPYKVFQDLKEVDYGIDIEEHRWYDTSITVYEVEPNQFLGVRSITSSKSESQYAEDCYVTLKFYEMEQINVISYKQK